MCINIIALRGIRFNECRIDVTAWCSTGWSTGCQIGNIHHNHNIMPKWNSSWQKCVYAEHFGKAYVRHHIYVLYTSWHMLTHCYLRAMAHCNICTNKSNSISGNRGTALQLRTTNWSKTIIMIIGMLIQQQQLYFDDLEHHFKLACPVNID